MQPIVTQPSAKITLTEASKITPGRPSISTLWRWCIKGSQGVTLQHWRYGGRIFTTPDAIERFAATLAAHRRNSIPTTPSLPPAVTRPIRRTQARRKRLQNIRQRCDAAGL